MGNETIMEEEAILIIKDEVLILIFKEGGEEGSAVTMVDVATFIGAGEGEVISEEAEGATGGGEDGKDCTW